MNKVSEPSGQNQNSLEAAQLLVERLVTLREFPNPSIDLDRFHNIVVQLRGYPRYDALLPRLFFAFSDADDYGVMSSLVHYVESFPSTTYVTVLVNAAHQLENINAKRWIPLLFVHIVNHAEYRSLLKTAFEQTNTDNQQAIRRIFEAELADIHDSELKHTLTERIEYVLSSGNA